MPAALECTPWELVTTPQQLKAAAARLRKAPFLAMDTEHHSQHSYLGITCLLQLSTGEPHSNTPVVFFKPRLVVVARNGSSIEKTVMGCLFDLCAWSTLR